jgi:hypothetical protein
VEANSTGGQDSRRAVAPSGDDEYRANCRFYLGEGHSTGRTGRKDETFLILVKYVKCVLRS